MINVWYSAKEHPKLSNLAKRVFKVNDKIYISVEHAYQTLKSGEFDVYTYTRNWKEGSKIVGRLPANKDTNLALMYKLIKASFEQNIESAKLLLSTGSMTITHTQSEPFWREHFPRLLMRVRDELREQLETTGEVGSKQVDLLENNDNYLI